MSRHSSSALPDHSKKLADKFLGPLRGPHTARHPLGPPFGSQTGLRAVHPVFHVIHAGTRDP